MTTLSLGRLNWTTYACIPKLNDNYTTPAVIRLFFRSLQLLPPSESIVSWLNPLLPFALLFVA